MQIPLPLSTSGHLPDAAPLPRGCVMGSTSGARDCGPHVPQIAQNGTTPKLRRFWSGLLPKWFELLMFPSRVYLLLLLLDCLCHVCVADRKVGVCAEPVLL